MLKFDVQTAKKLLSDYAEKINLYMKENFPKWYKNKYYRQF